MLFIHFNIALIDSPCIVFLWRPPSARHFLKSCDRFQTLETMQNDGDEMNATHHARTLETMQNDGDEQTKPQRLFFEIFPSCDS